MNRLRNFVCVLAAAVAVSVVSEAALAQEAPEVVPVLKLGEKVTGAVNDGVPIVVAFQGYPDTKLRVLAKAMRKSQARPTLSIVAPDGSPVSLVGVEFSKARGKKLLIKGLTLSQSGLYRLTVGTETGASGDVLLKVAGRYPTRARSDHTIGSPGAVHTVRFNAAEGDKVRINFKVPRGSSLQPDLSVTEASGENYDLTQDEGKIKLEVKSAGEHQLHITGANDTSGDFKARVKVGVDRSRRRGLLLQNLDLPREGNNLLPFCYGVLRFVAVPFGATTFTWWGDAKNCVDLDGTITSIRWDFSGGRPSYFTARTPPLEFPRDDVVTVDLTLTDNDGGTNVISFNVFGDRANGAPQPPPEDDPIAPFVGVWVKLPFALSWLVVKPNGLVDSYDIDPSGAGLCDRYEDDYSVGELELDNGRLKFRDGPLSSWVFDRASEGSLPPGCD